NRFDPATGTFAKYLAKPLDIAITTITADPSGALWLGTPNDGVLRWNPDDASVNAVTRPVPRDDRGLGVAPITAVLVASNGKLWFGSDGEGVVSLDPASGALVRYRFAAGDPGTLSDDHITSLFEDKRKNLWIGT